MNFKKSFLSKNPLHMHGMPDPTDPPAKTGKTTFSKTDEGFKVTTQQQETYVPKTEEEAKKARDYWSSLSEEEKQEIRDRKSAKSEFEFKKLPTIKDTINPTDMGSGDLEMAEDDSWVDEGKEETVEESRIGSGGSSSKTKIGKAQRPSTKMTYITSGTSDGGVYECKPGDDPVSCKMDLDAATKKEQKATAQAKKEGEKEHKKMLTKDAKEQKVDVKYKKRQEEKRSKATASKQKDTKKKAKKARKKREKEAKLLAKTKQEKKDTLTASF